MTRAAPLLIVCLVLLGLSGCTHGRRPVATSGGGEGDESTEGLASYYSASLEGRPTASGEPYRGAELTCAHRAYRFGTRLEVTNLENGRSVVVEVNDRGPFVKGRIIDLSVAAARELGMVERGVVRVRIKRLPPGS
jgi:rare lipoprotein A